MRPLCITALVGLCLIALAGGYSSDRRLWGQCAQALADWQADPDAARYKPVCDEHGNFAPTQCEMGVYAHSCWCALPITGERMANTGIWRRELTTESDMLHCPRTLPRPPYA